jgi:hypothetical protein
MSKEDFFTCVLQSYLGLLSSSVTSVPGLRDYCRSRHVFYRDFLFWSSSQHLASGIVEVARMKKRLEKASGIAFEDGCSLSSKESGTGAKPLLYPLRIVSAGICEGRVEPVVEPSARPFCGRSSGLHVLRGIRITYPTGVTLSIREASVDEVYCLVQVKVT